MLLYALATPVPQDKAILVGALDGLVALGALAPKRTGAMMVGQGALSVPLKGMAPPKPAGRSTMCARFSMSMVPDEGMSMSVICRNRSGAVDARNARVPRRF